jgi:hypothetical protein
MFALGVDREYKGKGVDALIYRACGSAWLIPRSPGNQLRSRGQLAMVNAITKLGAKPSRRYRVTR